MSTAQGTLDPLSKALDRSREQLEGFIATVDKVLKPKPPETLDEVRGTRTTLDGEVQGLRANQQAVKAQVTAINKLANKQQKALEDLIKEMVAAAVAWSETENVREGAEVVESLLNGVVNAAQALDSEPMSALAIQGLHSLIKGLSDGVKLSAAGIKSSLLKKGNKDVMGLIDKLEADAFIQAKLDLIKMGLSWLVEPLGLIPNVGAIVRSAANLGSGLVVGTLKKAAAKQAAAKEKKSGNAKVDTEIREAAEIIRESALGYVKSVLGGGVKALAKPRGHGGEFLMSVLGESSGPPLEAIVAKVVGEFDLVDKEQVKATVRRQSGRRRQAGQRAEGDDEDRQELRLRRGGGEEAVTIKNLDDLPQGQSCSSRRGTSPNWRPPEA